MIPLFQYENIELASEIQSSKDNFKSRMGQILDWLNHENIVNSKVDKLSNGEKQKLLLQEH